MSDTTECVCIQFIDEDDKVGVGYKRWIQEGSEIEVGKVVCIKWPKSTDVLEPQKMLKKEERKDFEWTYANGKIMAVGSWLKMCDTVKTLEKDGVVDVPKEERKDYRKKSASLAGTDRNNTNRLSKLAADSKKRDDRRISKSVFNLKQQELMTKLPEDLKYDESSDSGSSEDENYKDCTKAQLLNKIRLLTEKNKDLRLEVARLRTLDSVSKNLPYIDENLNKILKMVKNEATKYRAGYSSSYRSTHSSPSTRLTHSPSTRSSSTRSSSTHSSSTRRRTPSLPPNHTQPSTHPSVNLPHPCNSTAGRPPVIEVKQDDLHSYEMKGSPVTIELDTNYVNPEDEPIVNKATEDDLCKATLSDPMSSNEGDSSKEENVSTVTSSKSISCDYNDPNSPIWNECSKLTLTRFVNDAMTKLFTNYELRKSSVSGEPAAVYKNMGEEIVKEKSKEKLDPSKVLAIYRAAEKFFDKLDTKKRETTIKTTIRYKLNNAAKSKRSAKVDDGMETPEDSSSKKLKIGN